MEKLSVDYFFCEDSGKRYLHMYVKNRHLHGAVFAPIFGEIAETLLKYSFESICFDLSQLKLVPSGFMGVCVNLINCANEQKKNIKFRMNSETFEVARCASMDKLVTIEEVKVNS